MKRLNELKDLSIDELDVEILSLRKKQFELRMKKANGTLDKTHLVSQVRKLIAQIKTIQAEKVEKRHV